MAASTDLCTRTEVQNWLQVTVEADAFIDALIARASERIENHCDRTFLFEQKTEYFSGDEIPEGYIIIKSAPIVDNAGAPVRTQVQISADVAVYEDTNKVWGSGTAIDPTNLDVESEVGLIRSGSGFYKGAVGAIKVVYYGGYVTLPTDLTQAAIRLVAFWYNKAKQSADGIIRESEAGMSVAYNMDEMPESVLVSLDPYIRRRV